VTDAADVVDLARVIVSEEIRKVRQERWSGVLAMTQGEITKGLYFVEGEIAFAASTVEEDRLGANLFRIGRITEAQFRDALASAQEPGRRIGQALIEAGVLSPGELAAAVTGQVERIVLSVLRWTSGVLQRRTMDRPLPADLALDLNTARLLLLGARLFPDIERLSERLGGDETRLRRVAPRPFSYDLVPSSPAERAVLALCARPARLGQLLQLPHSRSRVIRAVYALVAGGMLEEVAPVSAARARTEAPSEATRLYPDPEEPEDLEPLPAAQGEPDPEAPAPPPSPEPAMAVPEWAIPAEPELSEGVASGSSAPIDPGTAESRARTLLDNRQRQAAAELLNEVLERHPDAHECRRLLAMTLAHEPGFRPEVEGHFLKTLEALPRDSELRHRLAIYYRRAGMSARAILQLRLVLSADPSHAAAWRDLGELEAGEGRRGGR
jgi:tetratricopeptide (TPR) repeat protein